MARRWTGVLARMGVPTGDGRILDPAGGASRALPLPLSWQPESSEGHDGSMIVGRIESVSFRDGMALAEGSMLDSAPAQVVELLDAGVIGPSVDLDDIEYVQDDAGVIVLTRWRISGATLVAIPAFADVSVTLDPEPVEPMADEPLTEFLYASAAPVRTAPAAWFQNPSLPGPMPLTVTDDGRVFGHIATWGSCHIGLPGCVTPPASPSGYAYFHQSSQMLDDGSETPVGTLVAGPRHADAQAAFQAAMAHYDDPSAAVAKVVAGDDEHGIWVSGWLLPDADPKAVEIFRSSPVSGDWRRIGGNLEMIAVCSVNAAGFPIPRARVAFSSGHQRALIGTFGVVPVNGHIHQIGNPDEDGGVMDDYDNCRDPECPGPDIEVPEERRELVSPEAAETARAKWAWAMAEKEI